MRVDGTNLSQRHSEPLAQSQAVPVIPQVKAETAEAVQRAAPTHEQMKAAVAQLNRMLKSTQNNLQFELDQDTGKTVVRIVDAETNEIIRQFPSEEVLKLARLLEGGGTSGLLKDSA